MGATGSAGNVADVTLGRRTLTLLIIVVICSLMLDSTNGVDASDRETCEDENDASGYGCNVLEFRTCDQFRSEFWMRKVPGIIRAKDILPQVNDQFNTFRAMTSRESLLKSNLSIKLSTSVSYTGRVYTDTTVKDYVADDSPPSRLGNETYYLFGNHEGKQWERFLSHYPRLESLPMFSCLNLDLKDAALSFGCAKGGTGVPWHFHGPGFLQVLTGSKMWFLTPFEIPNEAIRFDPNVTTSAWFEDEFRNDANLRKMITTCTLNEGDVIFFPPMWRHATYNMVWSSWISTFLK